MRSFLIDRIRLVRELLHDDELDVAYADLVLILCSVISACAALRWPGRSVDRRRFIELLVNHGLDEHHAYWVSVPSLINAGLINESDTPYRGGNSTRIFRGSEIDLPIETAISSYTTIPTGRLKSSSYATLIYEWLRCGYAHEYCPHESITHVPPSRHVARISYIGRIVNGNTIRMASFHLDYLIDLAEFHANNLPDAPSPRPKEWWIDAA